MISIFKSILFAVGGFFKKYFKEIIITIVILGFAWHYYNLISDNSELSAKVATLETSLKVAKGNLKSCKTTNEELQNSIDNYNDKVRELNKSKNAIEDAFSEQLQNEINKRKKLQDKLRDIQSETVPETCVGGVDWIMDKILEENINNEK